MAETGNGDPWQPMTGADPARIRHLGTLLRLRRAALGYPHVPQFTRDRRVNVRMVGDIEHGRRDTFTYPSLQVAARAYDVTYDSMMDVVWSGAGELVPAAPASPAPSAVPGLPAPPQDSQLVRDDAVRPYADPVWLKLLELRDQGIIDPTGEQLGLSPFYAKVWDDSAGQMVLSDRVWLVGTLLRNAAAWNEDRQQDATSA